MQRTNPPQPDAGEPSVASEKFYPEEAEQAVFGAIFIDPTTITATRAVVNSSSFFDLRHQILFGTMCELADGNIPIDPITLSDRLASKGQLEAAGGKDYIGFLMDAVPTSANVAFHSGIVARKDRERRLIEAANSVAAQLNAGALDRDVSVRLIEQIEHAAENNSPSATDVAYRTLEDIDDTPPAELHLGMFEPDGPNLIYGAGGVGKGSTLAYLAGEFTRAGMKPMIYDPENRPKEWARRTSGLGIERDQIIYMQPNELPRALMGEPLWEVIPHLGKVAAAAGADVLFVDSILAGMNIGEERLKSDAQAPYLYVSALDRLGIPSISTGHTSRATPEGEPYGSVSWVNAMRLTWLGTPAEGDGHRVRWRPRKRNERGHIPSLLLHFTYEGNTLRSVERADDELNTRDWLLTALRAGERTVEDLAEELAETFEEVTPAVIDRTKARLRQTLGRMKRDLVAKKTSSKRNSAWRLVNQTIVSQ